MIREFELVDIEQINIIGKQILENFQLDYFEECKKDYVKIYVYEQNKKVIGFIQIENHFEITDIINIAVNVDYQNQGVATKLLEYVINNINADKIMLEVRDDNISAINLYKKMGFEKIIVREKYYGNINGIVMERNI